MRLRGVVVLLCSMMLVGVAVGMSIGQRVVTAQDEMDLATVDEVWYEVTRSDAQAVLRAYRDGREVRMIGQGCDLIIIWEGARLP